MRSEKEVIAAEMEPLFERAEREGLWFHCWYQDLWFSPQALRQEHANGKFWWGACNWTLRDPMEQVSEAQSRAISAREEADRVASSVAAWEKSR